MPALLCAIVAFGLAGCETVPPMAYTPEARKMSYIDDALFKDSLRGLLILDTLSYPNVKTRAVVRIEVIEAYDYHRIGLERWIVTHDGQKPAAYIVKMVPDGRGGTNFNVGKDDGNAMRNVPILPPPKKEHTELIGRNPSVSLADETLFLASVEDDADVVLNEYIRKDETFANWKVLFAVRYIRSAETVDEVVMRWKAYIAQVRSPGKNIKEEADSSPTDRRFMLAIRPPGDAYLECDQLRFIPSPNGKGVIYYQAAVRVNPNSQSDLMQGLLKLQALAEALKSLTLQTVDSMPNQPLEATSSAHGSS
ncbi:MAG: hypothetical protein PHE83_00220 [Opitutaceae bacterium]|nr:hypothetical protein [Opitutaceae bacterium]